MTTAPHGTYTSSTTLREAFEWLEPTGRIAVLTHTKPDGDAIGSTLSLVRALRSRQPHTGRDGVVAFYGGYLPDWLASISQGDEWRHASVEALESFDPQRIVIADTGAWKQLEDVGPFLRGKADRVLVVDHHLDGDPDIADRRVIDAGWAAASMPAAELAVALCGVSDAGALPREIAAPLYVGLAADTGFFRHSNVSSAVMRLASELLRAGVDHVNLFEMIEQRDPAGRIRLLGKVLSEMELFCDDRLAVLTIRLADVHAHGLKSGQTSGFGDHVMTIGSVRVSAVLTEVGGREGPVTKMSLRSKGSRGAVDVNRIAREFHGGGHAQAAGARTDGDLESIKRRLVDTVARALD
ncbi:MAG: DHH family phosphoesterase [Phycisphaeraceae bacterium]|nr:DHH family phosphoesterase [Phycisphaeraceae bacterium]